MQLLEKYNNLTTEVRASTAYAICNILTKCLAFITLPIFTRMMTPEEYGITTIYASTAAVVVIFTSLQLPYGTLNTAMIKFKDDREGYLSSLCTISAALTVIYLMICFLFEDTLVEWLDLPFLLIMLMGIEMFFTTAQVAWMGYQRFEFKYKKVVAVTLGMAVSSVIVSLIFVSLSPEKGIAKVCSNAFVACVTGFVIVVLLIKNGRKPFAKKYWKFAFSLNVPLIPYYLSLVVFNQSDRLMINNICGRGDAAIYGVAYSLATVLTVIVTSIHGSYMPWIFERIDRKELQNNRRITILLSSCIAFMLLGVMVLAPEVVYILAGEQYERAVWAVPPIAMSVLLIYYADLFDCFLFFYEAKGCISAAAIVSAIANVILNYIFIPRFGFIAAAYTTLASYILLASIDYLYMLEICKSHGIDKNVYNIKGLIVIFFVFMGLGFSAMSLYNYSIVRYSLVAFSFALMFVFRNKLIALYKILRRK